MPFELKVSKMVRSKNHWHKAKATCKQMQLIPSILEAAVHRGKDTTHKSCTNENNIVALRFADHGAEQMFALF